MAVHIDRCYCFGVTFAELKTVAGATGAESVEELQDHATFGHNCRLCHPYVRRMLRTGRTTFHQIVTAEDEPTGG
jgi:bacterioferritin-associated ferredoxin